MNILPQQPQESNNRSEHQARTVSEAVTFPRLDQPLALSPMPIIVYLLAEFGRRRERAAQIEQADQRA